MPSIRSTLRGVRRLAKRLLWYAFLLTLPLTIFPLICGIHAGVVFHFWAYRRGQEDTHALTFEFERHNRLNYWNVPGAQSIHEFMDNKGPFYITRLKTQDWLEKLELSNLNADEESLNQGIDRMASLDGLARCTFHRPDAPTEYWIYITDFPEWSSNPWDKALDQLLQEAYIHPFAPTTRIFYLDCTTSGFLCGVWGVRRPTLVHLSMSNDSLADIQEREDQAHPSDTHHGHTCSPEVLHPMTAHIIEFPLDDDNAAALFPRNTLATPYLQLRAILFDLPSSAIPTLFIPWDQTTQLLARFYDHVVAKIDAPHTFWHHLNKADDWYTDQILAPVFGKTLSNDILGPMQSIIFTLTEVVCELVRIPFRLGWDVYAWYFGLAWDGEPMGTHDWLEDDLADGQRAPNMVDDMMAGFWNFVARNLSAQAAEDAAKAAVTERA